MKEKKVFILAIPTIIIIIVAVVGISLIFYNRNVKNMSREDVVLLSKKVANIKNISCEIVTSSNINGTEQSVANYKLRDNILVEKTNDFVYYDDNNKQYVIQIDDDEKYVYTYSNYRNNSIVDEFHNQLFAAEQLLENKELDKYTFNGYETMNGIKCVNFELGNSDLTYKIWLDKKSGMIVSLKTIDNNNGAEYTTLYRYQINGVNKEDVAVPNTKDYKVEEL